MHNIENTSIARVGHVSDYDPVRHMARVRFPDKKDLVSDWLQVVVPNSIKNKDEFHLDVNEHVLCFMMGNGLEKGYVIGSIWDNKNKPPTGDQDVRCTLFEDQTRISYDRKNHILDVDVKGDIFVHATGNITVRADKLHHTFGNPIDHN